MAPIICATLHIMARIRAVVEVDGRTVTLWTPKKGGRPPAMATWEVTVSVGKDSTGRWRQRSERLRGTKTNALDRAAQMEAKYGGRAPVEDQGRTLGAAVEAYITHTEAMGAARKTVRGYRSIANVMALKRGFVATKLRRLGAADLNAYYDWLRTVQGREPMTVRHHHMLISQVLNMAINNRWMEPPSPAAGAKPPSVEQPTPYSPAPEDARHFIATWASKPETRDKAAMLLLAGVSGCRRGEFCGWRWSDFDQDAGALVVQRSITLGDHGPVEKTTKTKRVRRIAVSAGVIAVLATQWDTYASACRDAELVPDWDSYVFSWRLDHSAPVRPDGLTQAFRRLREREVKKLRAAAAELDDNNLRTHLERRADRLGRVKLKHFRSFAATQMAAGHIDVKTASARMGHDGNVFMRHYAAVIDSNDQEAGALLESLLLPALSN